VGHLLAGEVYAPPLVPLLAPLGHSCLRL
jgi:hypothetical protein